MSAAVVAAACAVSYADSSTPLGVRRVAIFVWREQLLDLLLLPGLLLLLVHPVPEVPRLRTMLRFSSGRPCTSA